MSVVLTGASKGGASRGAGTAGGGSGSRAAGRRSAGRRAARGSARDSGGRGSRRNGAGLGGSAASRGAAAAATTSNLELLAVVHLSTIVDLQGVGAGSQRGRGSPGVALASLAGCALLVMSNVRLCS